MSDKPQSWIEELEKRAIRCRGCKKVWVTPEQLEALCRTALLARIDCTPDESNVGKPKPTAEDYMQQECGYNKDGDPICPKCGAPDEKLDLVSGDHGMKCLQCGAKFCCP